MLIIELIVWPGTRGEPEHWAYGYQTDTSTTPGRRGGIRAIRLIPQQHQGEGGGFDCLSGTGAQRYFVIAL